MATDNDQIIQLLGEIRGELRGVSEVIKNNHAAVNQRLEDMASSNERRFDAIEKRVEHVETEQKNMIWKISGWSGLGGALVAGVIELLKQTN